MSYTTPSQKVVPLGRPGGFSVEYPFTINMAQEQYKVLRDAEDGQHFVCKRAYLQSPYLKRIDQKDPVHLDIRPPVMAIIIHYLHYKLHYGAQVAKNKNHAEIPVFDPIPLNLASEVADAAALLEL